MKILSHTYGEIEIDDRQVIEFPNGILGFETYRKFALLDAPRQPFYLLQSMEDPFIGFILIDPNVFRKDYVHDVPEADLKNLGIEQNEDMLIMAIVTIPVDQTRISANLQGPIVINKKTRTGAQCISVNTSYKTKHFIIDEMTVVRNSSC
jgi:flagellar assembly factor FliW